MNCYQILGISSGATEEEIKKAYRKLAHLHHPDKGGDAKKFSQINTAYKDALDGIGRVRVFPKVNHNDFWQSNPMREQKDPFADIMNEFYESLRKSQQAQMDEMLKRKREAMEAERIRRRENLRRMMRESGVDPRMFGNL